jgi:azurin
MFNMRRMKVSMALMMLGLLLISCNSGKKDKAQMKIQSYERQEEPSEDVAHLQNPNQDESAEDQSEMNELEETEAKADMATAEKEVSSQDDVVELYLTGNDKMKFNTQELKVKARSTVKLVFEHVGKMSVQTMGHNFVLLKKGVDKMAFGQEASSYPSDGYIPPETDKVIAHTEMIGGGKKTTITFEAPAKGTYDYICSFPGHVALMNGKLIVE